MPAPTNQTAATAIDIGTSLLPPFTTTQNVNFGGTTYTVWYQYTAQPGDVVINVFGFGDLIAYSPVLSVFSPDSVTAYLSLSGLNVPLQFPVVVGNTYWFQFASNGGNVATAVLTLSARRAPKNSAPIGALFINDDTTGFPAAVLSAFDGTVLRFLTP